MFAEPQRQLARAIRVAGGVRVDVVRYANTAGFSAIDQVQTRRRQESSPPA